MSKALILSGFLGSGKTSLILRLGKYFAEDLKKKVVIIVNEIGEIGVDGDFLKKSGMDSYEITEGCICCTVRRDLESTLSYVLSSIAPDYVLIEPTGIAFPSVIKKIARKNDLDALVIGVADATRFVKLYSESREFIERQVREAEIISINKIDCIKSQAELKVLTEILKQLSPKAKIVFTSAKTGEGIKELAKLLSSTSGFEVLAEEFIDSTVESKASWYSAKISVRFKKPTSGVEVKSFGIELMESLKNRAGNIQHYKILISNSGALKFGLTRKEDAVSVDGSLAGWIVNATINVLLIDKDLSSEKIGKIFEDELTQKSKKFGFDYEIVEHEGEHHKVEHKEG
ncbi:MAG: GTP-binding protein [Archaeoglobales archaeon]|nr:GTP-binding protein [Archaeoglobales archaeon]